MVNRLVLFCVSCLFVVLFVSSVFSDEATDLAFIRKINPVTVLKCVLPISMSQHQ